MIKVIKNGIVVSMSEKRPIYESVDIIIKDNIIFDITNNYTGNYDEIIDASNKIVLPGLINGHTHLGMSLFRASNDNLNLSDWLNNKIWPIENNMNESDVYYTSLLSCIEMIKTGSVICNDMYFGSKGTLKAISDSKLRCLFGNNLINDNNNLEELDYLIKNNHNKLVRFTVAPHSFYTCSCAFLKKCSDYALANNLPVHIHFCENESETNGIKEKYGSIYNALSETGLLRNKLILAHATFIEDLDKLKDYDISIIHNPISNLNLGCGILDLVKNKNYFNIGLGTDGQGSGNNMNLFYHMSIVDLLQKGLYKDPSVFSSYETLKMATINGAKALGVDDIIGSIDIGKCADIIIVNLNKIESFPSTELITNLVHNCSNIDTTIINGEVLMKNHKLLLNIDENLLMKKVENIYKKLNF